MPARRSSRARAGVRSRRGVDPGTVKGANDPSNPFPTVAASSKTIDDLGGWSKVNDEYFDATNGIVTKIESGSS